jgi:hypothetical protein
MTFPKVFRNNYIEGLPDSFLRREAEDPLRTFIPEGDPTFRVGINDRIGCLVDKSPIEPVDIGIHGATFLWVRDDAFANTCCILSSRVSSSILYAVLLAEWSKLTSRFEADQADYECAARNPQELVPDEGRGAPRSRIGAVEERKRQSTAEGDEQIHHTFEPGSLDRVDIL